MTTTIAPSLGAAPLFTQQGVGTTPGYSAIDDRRADSAGLQEGVLGQGASAQDFMVQQRLAGATMSVEITMPAGGGAMVQGDSVTGQGLYYVPVHSANIIETISANASGSPRIDSIILEVLDNVHDASGNNLVRTRVLTGTPTGGTTLDSRAGAVTLPGSALLLADVLVANGAASITNSVIRDRRKWARGTFVRLTKTNANAATSSTSLVTVDVLRVSARIECSGAPLRLTLLCSASNGSAGGGVATGALQDGAAVDGATQLGTATSPTGGNLYSPSFSHITVPAAGSHVFDAAFAVTTGATTATMFGSATLPIVFMMEEIVRQNTANNTVTTG